MENNVAVGSQFTVGPSAFTQMAVGSVFSVAGADFFTSSASVGSSFYLTTVDDGDPNSSYPQVHYLYVGRTGR